MIAFGEFRFDLDKGQLTDGSGHPVRLRNKSLRTLCALAEAEGHVVSKDEIISKVWGKPFVSDESLSQCISDIRRAISDADKKILQTVPGQGFLLAGRREEQQSRGQIPTVSVEQVALIEDDPVARIIASRIVQEMLQAMSRRSGIRVLSGTVPENSDYVIRGSLLSNGNTRTAFMEIMEVAGRGDVPVNVEL